MTTTTAVDHPDDDEPTAPRTFGEFVRAQLAGDRKAAARDFARRLTSARKHTNTMEESE